MAQSRGGRNVLEPCSALLRDASTAGVACTCPHMRAVPVGSPGLRDPSSIAECGGMVRIQEAKILWGGRTVVKLPGTVQEP